jgi:uncharacterized protein (DUF2237 family)
MRLQVACIPRGGKGNSLWKGMQAPVPPTSLDRVILIRSEGEDLCTPRPVAQVLRGTPSLCHPDPKRSEGEDLCTPRPVAQILRGTPGLCHPDPKRSEGEDLCTSRPVAQILRGQERRSGRQFGVRGQFGRSSCNRRRIRLKLMPFEPLQTQIPPSRIN